MARGVQYLPIRYPRDAPAWFVSFMDTFVKDVLANADVRNAVPGNGIDITGQPDQPATISSSEDLQQLLDENYILAEPSPFLANSRRFVGENGVISVADEGAGGEFIVGIEAHGIQLEKLGQIDGLSIVSNPFPAAGEVELLIGSVEGAVPRIVDVGSGTLNVTFDQIQDTLITVSDESSVLPNSRVLTAGAGVSLDTSTPGQIAISAPGGALPVLADEILDDSPTAFWKLDEASGTFADSSGNGHTLTASGSVNYQRSGLIGPLYTTRFLYVPDGSNSARVSGVLGTSPPLTGDWTVEAVVNARAFGSNNVRIFSMAGNGETAATNYQIYMHMTNAGSFQMFWETGNGTNIDIISGITLDEGHTYHLVCVKDGTANTVTFYVNGVEVAVVGYASEPTGGTDASMVTAIGADGGGGSTGDMVVGYVAFYNGLKLSASRIATHAYAAGLM